MQTNKGFTLIELLVTMVVAMVVLGGLMTSFIQQNSEYKYQNKRVDAVQDLEFAIKFIAEDLRSAVMVTTDDVVITNAVDPFPTTSVAFNVWENDVTFWTNATEQATANYRAGRRYEYDSGAESLSYDRNTVPTVGMTEILPNVTFFKVFNDSSRPATTYTGIPTAQLPMNLENPTVSVAGYTILVEVKVDAGYKNGSFLDVLGNDQSPGVGDGYKRVWRYAQVYPMASVE